MGANTGANNNNNIKEYGSWHQSDVGHTSSHTTRESQQIWQKQQIALIKYQN